MTTFGGAVDAQRISAAFKDRHACVEGHVRGAMGKEKGVWKSYPPYGRACGTITPEYGQWVGVKTARSYRDAIRRLFGRTAGSTRMNELAAAMDTAAIQAMWEDLWPEPDAKPPHIDGCHALKADGPQVAQFFPK